MYFFTKKRREPSVLVLLAFFYFFINLRITHSIRIMHMITSLNAKIIIAPPATTERVTIIVSTTNTINNNVNNTMNTTSFHKGSCKICESKREESEIYQTHSFFNLFPILVQMLEQQITLKTQAPPFLPIRT